MKLFQATNTAALEYIKDKLRPADGVSKERYLENLALWLVNSPQTIWLTLAFEGDELKAFMVAYLPPQVNFVFISQVWSEQPNTAHDLLTRLVEWAESCGRTQLRMESESDHDDYTRAWGFKTITETRAIDLSDFYGGSLYDEGGDSGEGVVESTAGGLPTNSPIQQGSISEDDFDAEGNVRDRTSAQDEALQHSLEGTSEGGD